MKNRLLAKSLLITGVIVLSLTLFQCEAFLGNNDNVNVGIDLSDFLGGGAGRSISPQFTVTEIHVSVFGPGMEPLEKIVSPNIPGRTVNLYVPSGAERHFTIEVFIVPVAAHPHVISYKGRATADLRPGRYTGLKIRMVAAATQMLVPDFNNSAIFQAADMTFTPYQSGNLNLSLHPADLDISAAGTIFAANDFDGFSVGYANDLIGTGAGTTNSGPLNTYALAMDRDASININEDPLNIRETNLLYLYGSGYLEYCILDDAVHSAGLPSDPAVMNPPGLTQINGMAVDPWTHHLFIVGENTGVPAIVEYDPTYIDPGKSVGRVVQTVTGNPVFETLNDIIVKDTGIFVLNAVALSDTTVPVLLKFDHSLNYLGGFGTISSVSNFPQAGWLWAQSFAPGKFYHPIRFFCQENDGLYIADDAQNFNKLVFITENLDPASWRTFPADGTETDPFLFFDAIQ